MNKNTGNLVLTTKDINSLYAEDDWCGYGYLGERQSHYFTQTEMAVLGDRLLLEHANESGWDRLDLFMFCNSRIGRHYGDLVFGGFTYQEIFGRGNLFFADFAREAKKGPVLS